MTCAQCNEAIDERQPYHLGGEIGIMGEITRPSHLGDCETMAVFVWAPAVRTPVISVRPEWIQEVAAKRSAAAQKAWATMRAKKAA